MMLSMNTFKILNQRSKSKRVHLFSFDYFSLIRRDELLRLHRGNKHDRIRLTENDLTVRLIYEINNLMIDIFI